MKNGDVRESV